MPTAGPGLAIGITEQDANLVASPADRDVIEPWARWRKALGAIDPAYYRLMVDWATLQPSPDAPADFNQPRGGCINGVEPCLSWAGVHDQLRALASRQREGGWEALVVITRTPEWASAPPSGCERPDTSLRSRPPRADALPAYRKLVADLLAAAAKAGAELRFWSAWNEPNHPAFISPQRARCRTSSPSTAPAAYADLVRALQQALADSTGDHRLVLGETAGYLASTRFRTGVPEFIAGLPRDVACASTIWSQHAYIGGDDPIDAAATALAAHGCPEPHTFWISETGVGMVRTGLSPAQTKSKDHDDCSALHAGLVGWFHDPRVTVAIQYTVRQDDRFPIGLVTTDLSAARPALAEWTAWGGARPAAAPPPEQAC